MMALEAEDREMADKVRRLAKRLFRKSRELIDSRKGAGVGDVLPANRDLIAAGILLAAAYAADAFADEVEADG